MAASDSEKLFCRVLWYFLSGLSLSASLLTLLLISRMKRWNGVLLLTVSLTCCEALYDFGLLLTSASYYSGFLCQLQGVFIYFSGMACSLWTSCFSSIILMLVIGTAFESIFALYKYFFAISIGLPLILTLLGVGFNFISANYLGCFVKSQLLIFEDIYDFVIFLSVLFNIISFGMTWKKISDLGADSTATKALKEVTFRMVYYPIVQTLCWTFIWVTLFTASGSDQADPEDFFPLLVDSLTSPMLGLGMFIVFLIQQPLAREQLPFCKPSKGKTDGINNCEERNASENPISISFSGSCSSMEESIMRVSYAIEEQGRRRGDSFSTNSFTDNPLQLSFGDTKSLSSVTSSSLNLPPLSQQQVQLRNLQASDRVLGPKNLTVNAITSVNAIDYSQMEDDALIFIIRSCSIE